MDARLDRLIATLGAAGDRTIEEVAAEHGVDPAAIVATRRALGLPAQRATPTYGAELDEHAELLRFALEAGVPIEALVTLDRTIGTAMASIVGATQDMVRDLLGDTPAAERDLAAAELVQTLLPALDRVLVRTFREHGRQLLAQEAVAQALLDDGAAEPQARTVAVGFADLVGFTALGQREGAAQLARVAGELERLALDALAPGASLVKVLGDGVLLVAEQPAALLATATRLRDAVRGDGKLPELRVGLALGPALPRAGDWYGPAVNLASRLTALAPVGGVVADPTFAAATPDAPWTAAGRREVRGLEGPVALQRLDG